MRLPNNKALEVELLDPEISGLTYVLQRQQELQFSRALALQRLDMRAAMQAQYPGAGLHHMQPPSWHEPSARCCVCVCVCQHGL